MENFLFKEENFDIVHSIIHILLRHGCCPYERSVYGMTARSLAEDIASSYEQAHAEFEAIHYIIT